MLINLYDVEYAHREYERRVQAHLLEQAIRQARAARTATIAQRLDQLLRLVTQRVTTTRRRQWNRLQQAQG